MRHASFWRCIVWPLVLCSALTWGASLLGEILDIKDVVPTVFEGITPFISKYKNPCYRSKVRTGLY